MTKTNILHFQTSDALLLSRVVDVLQAQVGGRVAAVDDRRKANFEDGAVPRVGSHKVGDTFVGMLVHRGTSITDVAARCATTVIDFLREHPGTIEQQAAILVSALRNSSSEQVSVDIVAALESIGMRPDQLRVIHIDAPRSEPIEIAFPIVHTHLHGGRFPRVTQQAIISAPALDSASQLPISAGAVLHGAVDFEAELKRALDANEQEDALRALARQVFVQRALLGAARDFQQLADALELPRVPREEWLVQASHQLRLPIASPETTGGEADPEDRVATVND